MTTDDVTNQLQVYVKNPFTYEGENKQADGDLFVARVLGNLKVHPNEELRELVDEFSAGPFDGHANTVLHLALLGVCDTSVVQVVMEYPRAYMRGI